MMVTNSMSVMRNILRAVIVIVFAVIHIIIIGRSAVAVLQDSSVIVVPSNILAIAVVSMLRK